MRKRALAMEMPARPNATAPTPNATTQRGRSHHVRNAFRTPKNEAIVWTAWHTCTKLMQANFWNRSRAYINTQRGSNSNSQQRKRRNLENHQEAIQATRRRTTARVVARDGYMRNKKNKPSRIYFYVSPKYVPADHPEEMVENSATTGRPRETSMRRAKRYAD